MSERVHWLTGGPEPSTLWTEHRRDCRWEHTFSLMGRADSVRVVALMSLLIFHWMGRTIRAGGRIGSGSDEESVQARKGVSLTIVTPWMVGHGKVELREGQWLVIATNGWLALSSQCHHSSRASLMVSSSRSPIWLFGFTGVSFLEKRPVGR